MFSPSSAYENRRPKPARPLWSLPTRTAALRNTASSCWRPSNLWVQIAPSVGACWLRHVSDHWSQVSVLCSDAARSEHLPSQGHSRHEAHHPEVPGREVWIPGELTALCFFPVLAALTLCSLRTCFKYIYFCAAWNTTQILLVFCLFSRIASRWRKWMMKSTAASWVAVSSNWSEGYWESA